MMQVLVVDDDPVAVVVLRDALEFNGYKVLTAGNGEEAVAILRKTDIRLMISDWDMPRMDGVELCSTIRKEDLGRYIYTILLTAKEGTTHVVEGLSAGADDFLTKPYKLSELMARLRAGQRVLGIETRDLAIFSLAKLAESRDPETGQHLERVQNYSSILAKSLEKQEEFSSLIDAVYIQLLHSTCPLHDIGKVAIPDRVLLKPSRLDEEEFEIMKTHTTQGALPLSAALEKYPEARFLQMARDIAAYHHERYDGKGYPEGLSGTKIPLCARIFALVDV